MSAKLQGEDDKQDHLKRPQYQPSCFTKKNLEDFVTPKAMRFFKILHLDTNFLNKYPSLWSTTESFQFAKSIVKSLRVTNDNAERGVGLVKSYNRLLTKNEEQLQFLLQVVSEHRCAYPDALKTTLTQSK